MLLVLDMYLRYALEFWTEICYIVEDCTHKQTGCQSVLFLNI